jgi:hypothetical protein
LSQLADLRAQMLLSKYRAGAAAGLIAIAGSEEPTELSRKACVDLLKLDLGLFSTGFEPIAAPTSSAPSEQAILDALEAIGADADDPPPSESAG